MFQFFPVSLQSQMQAVVIDNKAPVCLNKFAMPKAKSLDSSDASCWGQYGLELVLFTLTEWEKWTVFETCQGILR